MDIKVSKGDILWSYLAQFFNLGAGLITLPIIMKMLSADDVGFNYILITINSIVAVFDMGFTSQFSRNITYVLSGAQSIEKEGISAEYSSNINEHLLSCVIKTAKLIYMVLALIALGALLTLGTMYIWMVTNGGQTVENLIAIWSIFCLSCFFNIYFLYFSSFLQGKGLIKEAKQGQVYSKIVQIAITFGLLLCGCGLISVTIANLIAPFVYRFYAKSKFYDAYIKKIVEKNSISKDEIKETFNILFFNAKKMGVISILTSTIGYASTLILGAFLSLSDVGSYGVLVQLTNVIGSVSMALFLTTTPKIGQLMVRKEWDKVRLVFGLSQFFYIGVQVCGLVAMLLLPSIFIFFSFNTQMPAYYIIVLFYVYRFVEQKQSMYSQLLLIQNDLVFFKANVWTGIFCICLMCIFLYLKMGLLGVVLSQCIPLYTYSAWKWPLYSSKKYDIIFTRDILLIPYKEYSSRVKAMLYKLKSN